jgi:hypothetical protein
MKAGLVKSAPFLFALAAIGVLACDQGTMSSGTRSRVVFKAGELLGVLGGDFVSVLDTARLTITSDGQQQTMTQLFGAGDSETSFDVSLKSGPATFSLDVISNNGIRLYRGEQTSTISENGFAVTITPQPDTAVMVEYPGHPTLDTATIVLANTVLRLFTATLNVRNPGIADLTWRVDSLASLPTSSFGVSCVIPSQDDRNCLRNVLWPATTAVLIKVTFLMPAGSSLPAQGIRFVADVGSLVVETAPFASVPASRQHLNAGTVLSRKRP